MDVRAIILIGAPIEPYQASNGNGTSLAQLRNGRISAVPMALLPFFGRSLVTRMAEQLVQAGIDHVAILSTSEAPFAEQRTPLAAQISWKKESPENIWRSAEEEFAELAQGGAELVLVLRMGPYVEINLDHLLQFHIDQRSRVTQVWDSEGPMDLFVISSSRRNDAAHLFRTRLTRSRVSVREFHLSGYVNRLERPSDFRQLTLDSFNLKTAIEPGGKQIRPGIWVEDGAKIDRGARIVAPAYIGAHSRVRASSLLTHGSAIEHHCLVDCGTAIDNSTVLPFSEVGPGLDLCNSILGFLQVTNLKREVTVEIADPKIIRAISQAASVRLVAQTVETIAYLPKQIWRGLTGTKIPQAPSIAETTNVDMQHYDAPRIGDCAREDSKVFDPDLAVVRRYGNQ